MLDHQAYDILGVDRESTPDEIRCAFRRAALLHHPDKGGDPERFNDVKSAYDLLSRKTGTQQQAQIDLADILSKGFVKLYESFTKSRAKKDLAITLRIDVSLRELYEGNVKKLNIKTFANGVPCNKTFYIPMRGFVPQRVFVGGGDADERGLSGDLIVNFDVTDAEPFHYDTSLDGHDLFVTVPVDLHAYLVGGQRTITLPDGDVTSVTFGPFFGPYKRDTMAGECTAACSECVTVRGRGMPFGEAERGDLLVKLQLCFDARRRHDETLPRYIDDDDFIEKLRGYFAEQLSSH